MKRLRLSLDPARLERDILEALVQAATAKCLEVNVLANGSSKDPSLPFVLVSALRGVCEDLIYLAFLSRSDPSKVRSLVTALIKANLDDGVAAQKAFFDANNPTQPIVGSTSAPEEFAAERQRGKAELRAAWQSLGFGGSPKVREVAQSVGLLATYDYIYFLASNFVHFNPHSLLRMGWANKGSAYVFSVVNMAVYYRHVVSFYGAILFLGYEAAFGQRFYKMEMKDLVDELVGHVGGTQRWPEVVTFEELNIKPPLFLMTHSVGQMMREDDPSMPYGRILEEVMSLRES